VDENGCCVCCVDERRKIENKNGNSVFLNLKTLFCLNILRIKDD
jgi:hypothetical protein